MINRDENGVIVSADKIADVTETLKDVEKKISKAIKKKDKLSEEENAELAKSAGDLEKLLSIVTPEMQKSASPIEVIGYLKQVVNIKKIAEKIQEMKND